MSQCINTLVIFLRSRGCKDEPPANCSEINQFKMVVPSLLNDVENAGLHVLYYKNQCRMLVKNIISAKSNGSEIETISFLSEILNFFNLFHTKLYIIKNWMQIDDSSRFLQYHHKWSVLSGAVVVSCSQTEVDEDENCIRRIVEENLKEYSALQHNECRVFNNEMMDNLAYLRSSASKPKVELRQICEPLFRCAFNQKCLIDVGGFGSVFHGFLRGIPVAVKRVRECSTDDYEENCAALKKEAIILQTHSFPGVVRIFGVDDKIESSFIVMELAKCSLYSALHKTQFKALFTEKRKIEILLESCATFAFLHSLGIVHRDIKSSNILMMLDGHVKVTDFGIAKSVMIQKTKGEFMKGTMSYIAPELWLQESTYLYDEATDMYAFAILMNEVLTEEKPFDCKTQVLALKMQNSEGLERPPVYSLNMGLKSLIEICWDIDSRKRLTFQSLRYRLRKFVHSVPASSPDPIVEVRNLFIGSSLSSGYYTGSMKGNQRCGKGLLHCLNGDIFQGDWLHDELNGHCQIHWNQGDQYSGHVVLSYYNDHGVYKHADGGVYDGEWKNDFKEGHGVFRQSDGGVYDGEWKNGRREGHGVFRQSDGGVYDGEWKNDFKEGHGVFRQSDGGVYDGEWKNDVFEGHGVFRQSDGGVYDGEWKNSRREGHGVFRQSNGGVYDGEWKDDVSDGHGVFRQSDGGVYDGEWKNGRQEGHGVYRYPDGGVYDGEWKNSRREGHGVYRYPDGGVYDGEWKNGRKVGHVIATCPGVPGATFAATVFGDC